MLSSTHHQSSPLKAKPSCGLCLKPWGLCLNPWGLGPLVAMSDSIAAVEPSRWLQRLVQVARLLRDQLRRYREVAPVAGWVGCCFFEQEIYFWVGLGWVNPNWVGWIQAFRKGWAHILMDGTEASDLEPWFNFQRSNLSIKGWIRDFRGPFGRMGLVTVRVCACCMYLYTF